MENNTFAKRFREALNVKGIKQSEIASKSGIPKSSISSYLSGKYVPKQTNIYKLAKTLNINPSWLMGLDVPMELSKENNPKSLKDFLNEIKYEDIDNLVKNDKTKVLISYIDFPNIVLMLYPDSRFEQIKEQQLIMEKNINTMETVISEIKKIKEKNSKVRIKDDINLSELEDSLLFAKKNKLYLSIAKYYSKDDILNEIDQRNIFIIADDNNKPVKDKRKRLDIISNIIENVLKNINKERKK